MSQFEMEDQDIFDIFRQRDEKEGRIPTIIPAEQILEVVGEVYDPEKDGKRFDFRQLPVIAAYLFFIASVILGVTGIISASAAFLVAGFSLLAGIALQDGIRWY